MNKIVVILIFILTGSLLFVLLKLIQFNGLYGQDAHEYYRYARELHNNYSTAKASPYFPPVYSYAGAVLGGLTGILSALQLISTGSFLLSLYMIYCLIRKIFPNSKFLLIYILSFGFLSPYFFRMSTVVMSDSLACCLLVVSFYFMLCFYYSNKIRYLLLFIAAAFVCLLTRYSSATVLLPMFLLLVYFKRNVLIKPLPFLIAALVILAIGAFFFYIPSYLSEAFHHPLFNSISPLNFFHSSFSSNDGNHVYNLPNAIFIIYPLVHPGFIFVGIILLFFIRKEEISRPEILMILIPAVCYLLFLSFLPTQNIRLQTLIFPLLLIIYFPAFERFYKWLSVKKLVVPFFFILQTVLIYFSLQPVLKINHIEKEIAADLRTRETNFRTLYELGTEGIVNSYDVRLKPVSLYPDTLSSVNDSSLLLINKSFTRIWKNKLPELNLSFLQSHDSLIKLNEFSEGWQLYEIKKIKLNSRYYDL